MPAAKKKEEVEEAAIIVADEPKLGSLSLSTKEFELAIKQEDEHRKLLMNYTRSHLNKDAGDYNEIQGRKSLGKPGAEKICSLFKVTIGEPEVAHDAYELLPSSVKDVGAVVFKTKLYRNGEYIGAGIGARTLTQDRGDVNKMMKMARKSSIIDAVLSTFGLSDLFTQDLEDMDIAPSKSSYSATQRPSTTSDAPASDKQRQFARTLLVKKGIKDKESADQVVKHFTNVAAIDELTKDQASKLIEGLTTLTSTEIQAIGVFGEEAQVESEPF